MELTESILRLTWDPDGDPLVLVDWGDPLWDSIVLDGRQVIQQVALVRAAGIQAKPRRNESHTLRCSVCVIEETIDAAFAGRLNRILALPRTMADVLISLEDGQNWRLKNAAIEAWPGGQEERLTRETLEIIGGELLPDEGAYAPGGFWQEDSSLWEA